MKSSRLHVSSACGICGNVPGSTSRICATARGGRALTLLHEAPGMGHGVCVAWAAHLEAVLGYDELLGAEDREQRLSHLRRPLERALDQPQLGPLDAQLPRVADQHGG